MEAVAAVMQASILLVVFGVAGLRVHEAARRPASDGLWSPGLELVGGAFIAAAVTGVREARRGFRRARW